MAEAQVEDQARRARAARGAGALAYAGAGCARAATPARRDGAGAAAAVVVPSPSTAGDDVVPSPSTADHDTVPSPPEPRHAPAQGDSATALRLVERAQQGDADAFGELYDRYVDVVFRYISYRVGDRTLAEDMTSETFLRALRRVGSFTWQGRDVGAWFVTIARNLIADHYKSSRYKLEMTTDDVGLVGDTGGRLVEESPEGAVLESMQNKVLLEAVKQLNAEQQECIALRFLQGLSVAETAAIMGKNEGAIKALQYRAVRTLGRLLPEGVEL
ncbi:MAG: ECF subfamily RNA polymerase sigma factor, BldN family [Actinomycetes bacterium]